MDATFTEADFKQIGDVLGVEGTIEGSMVRYAWRDEESGRKLALVRRLIQQRELRGPQIRSNALGRRAGKRALTSEGLVRAYQQEAARQKLLIKKAELTQGRLMFVREAFREAGDKQGREQGRGTRKERP